MRDNDEIVSYVRFFNMKKGVKNYGRKRLNFGLIQEFENFKGIRR